MKKESEISFGEILVFTGVEVMISIKMKSNSCKRKKSDIIYMPEKCTVEKWTEVVSSSF